MVVRLSAEEELKCELEAEIAGLRRELLLEQIALEPPQHLVTTDGVVMGTPCYIAPEVLVSAGFDVAWLRIADERVGDQGGLDDSEAVELETDWLD